jgi:glucan 1,3-beta-glucosidase
MFVGVFQNMDFLNCGTGIDTGGAGSLTVLDSTAQNVGRVIATGESGNGQGSIIIDNLNATSVGSIVQNYNNNKIILPGTGPTVTVDTWAQGNVYLGLDDGHYMQRTLSTPYKPDVMLDQGGRFFTRSRPVYQDAKVSDIVNVKDLGAKGDGRSDDTEILNSVLLENAKSGKITYFPHGYYVVTDSIYVPPNSKIFGEVWSTINGNVRVLLST